MGIFTKNFQMMCNIVPERAWFGKVFMV
jgi:hypothetical protein